MERAELLAEAQQQVYKRTYNRDEVRRLKGKELSKYQKKFQKVSGDVTALHFRTECGLLCYAMQLNAVVMKLQRQHAKSKNK